MQEQQHRGAGISFDLRPQPVELIRINPPFDLSGDVAVETEHPPFSRSEGECQVSGRRHRAGKCRADRIPVVVIAGDDGEAVEPWPQPIAQVLVGRGFLVLREVTRQHQMIDPLMAFDVCQGLVECLAGGNAGEPAAVVRKQVQIGELDDACVGHASTV